MAGKSGPVFERQVCKELSRMISGQARDNLFWRTPASGARSTQRAKQGRHLDECGDIRNDDPSTKWLTEAFLMELKNGYATAFDVLPLLDKKLRKNHHLFQWAKKAAVEAHEHKRSNYLLILNRKRRGRYVVICQSCMEDFIDHNFFLDTGVVPQIHIEYEETNGLVVMEYDVFWGELVGESLPRFKHMCNVLTERMAQDVSKQKNNNSLRARPGHSKGHLRDE